MRFQMYMGMLKRYLATLQNLPQGLKRGEMIAGRSKRENMQLCQKFPLKRLPWSLNHTVGSRERDVNSRQRVGRHKFLYAACKSMHDP